MTPAPERPDLVDVPDLGDVQMRPGASPETTPRAAAPAPDAGLREEEAIRAFIEHRLGWAMLTNPTDWQDRDPLLAAAVAVLSRQAEKETA